MASGGITIHGGSGSDTINFAFTVTGTQTLSHATAFQDTVNSLLTSGGGGTLSQLSPFSFAASPASGSSLTHVYELVPSTVQGAAQSFAVQTSGYVVDTIGGASTVFGASVGGDTVLVAQINVATTFEAFGSNNEVIFVNGDNTYIGKGTGGDTVAAGSGHDTINTGSGATTVNSGTGYATVTLNDTGTSAFIDHVWLDDGHATVYAYGAGDAVIATAEGQTIIGGAGNLTAVLTPNSDGTANGNDSITAGSGATTVWDSSSNNTVNAGSGLLYLVAGANITADVTAGSGSAYLFGNKGADITVSGSGNAYFYAGTGNETLNGSAASGNLYLFGGDSTSVDSLVGGSGKNLLVAGGGSETLQGGSGANTYLVDASATGSASVTFADFASGTHHTLELSGFSQADVQTLLSGGKDNASGNYVVSLSNGVTLTFDGISSGQELNGHIVTFK